MQSHRTPKLKRSHFLYNKWHAVGQELDDLTKSAVDDSFAYQNGLALNVSSNIFSVLQPVINSPDYVTAIDGPEHQFDHEDRVLVLRFQKDVETSYPVLLPLLTGKKFDLA
jgi:hypothetical protein